MKTATLGTACIMVVSAVLLLLLALTNIDLQESSIRNTLGHALESSLRTATDQQGKALNRDQIETDVIEGISMNLKADAQLTVTIYQADAELGIISARATATYPSIIKGARPTTVTARRTVIREQYERPAAPRMITITYMTVRDGKDWTYKTYSVPQGTTVPVPKDPGTDLDDTPFTGWGVQDGSAVRPVTRTQINAMRADHDLTFRATRQ
jgi:hypothetical protein